MLSGSRSSSPIPVAELEFDPASAASPRRAAPTEPPAALAPPDMENAVVDDGKNRHGFPRGYHFVPHDHELMRLLDLQLDGRRLPHPLPNIFRGNVKILDSHPADLYDEHKEHEEAGYIYFFNEREYPTTRGRRPMPKRATKDGGNWKATGGSKELWRGGAVVGYKLTMVFYQKEEPRKTDWALHEYTRIDGLHGPDRKPKVTSLALYRLYKKKAGQGAVPAPAELEANQASVPASSSSPQAQVQATAGVPHHHDHQDASNWVTPAAVNPHAGVCMWQTVPPTSPRQEAVSNFGHRAGLAGWHNMPLLSLSPPVSAVVHDLPVSGHSSYPDTTDFNNEQSPPPVTLPAPSSAADGYPADEFDVWCKMKQKQDDLPASPMPYDGDLPMLMDESKLYSFTLEELLAPMQDDLLVDANQDDTAAPVASTADERRPLGLILQCHTMQKQSTSGS